MYVTTSYRIRFGTRDCRRSGSRGGRGDKLPFREHDDFRDGIGKCLLVRASRRADSTAQPEIRIVAAKDNFVNIGAWWRDQQISRRDGTDGSTIRLSSERYTDTGIPRRI